MLVAPSCGGAQIARSRFVKEIAFVCIVALAAAWGQSLSAHPYYAQLFGEACSQCHGDNAAMGTTPANGGTLQFFKTLVGRSSTASFTVSDTSTIQAGPPPLGGGGFTGSFPTASAPFSTTTNLAFNAAPPDNAVAPYNYILPPSVAAVDGGQSSISQVYTFTPTTRGAFNQSITFTPSAGFPNTVPSSTVTLSGQAVAPVISLNSTLAAAGNVRIGGTGTAKVTINNVGDGNQAGSGLGNLTGTVASGSGGFSGGGGSFNLSDGGSQSFSFTVSPTTHGPVSTSIAVNTTDGSTNGTNNAQSLSMTLSATGVGPTLSTSVAAGSTLAFSSPQVPPDILTIVNATTDANLGALTNLDLISATLSGAGSSMFSLSGLTAGTTLTKSQSANLQISFTPTAGASGTEGATLTLVTDEGAANGAAGKTISFTLAGTAAATTSFFWSGGHSGTWNSTSPGFNWTVAAGSTTEVGTLPSATSDIFFTSSNPGTASTTLGQDFSVKSVTFSASSAPMTIGGSNTLTILGGLTVSGGTASHTISAPVQLGAAQTWTTNGSGTLADSGPISGSAAFTKSGSGTLLLSGSNTFSGGTNVTAGTLQVGAGGALPLGMNVSVSGSGSAIAMNDGLTSAVKIGGLSIDGGASSPQAVFDVGNGKLIVDKTATSLATIQSEIISGRAGGSWTGPGITSSAAAADVLAGGGTSNTALGYADNSDFGMGLTTFGGQPVNSNSLLVRYTLLGDANLDGKVDLSDFLSLRHNFGLTSGATWDESDFNYDGKVDLSDFLILRANFGQSLPSGLVGASAPLGAAAAELSPVPEPATIVLVGVILACAASAAGHFALRRRLYRHGKTARGRIRQIDTL